MKITVTSVVDEDIAELVRRIGNDIEEILSSNLENKAFGEGVEQFVIVIIAVEPDPELNARFSKSHNSSGKYKHPITGEWIRYLSVGGLLNPVEVAGLSKENAKQMIIAAILNCLDKPQIKIPKNFDYLSFEKEVRRVLEEILQ